MTGRCTVAILALAIAGCGGEGLQADDTCVMELEAPASADLGATVVLSATMDAAPSGFRDYDWEVMRDGVSVPFTLRDVDGRDIEFVADQPGPYDVALGGGVGSTRCRGLSATINVVADPGSEHAYLARVSHAGVVYVRSFTVHGGGDFGLGTVDLSAAAINLGVYDAAGAPIDGVLRFTSESSPAGAVVVPVDTGTATVALAGDSYDAAVMPYDVSISPYVVRGLSAPLPARLDGPDTDVLSATVSAGGALASATVRVASDGGPAAIATTDGGGHAGVAVQPGTSVAVGVVPPEGSALPRVSIDGIGTPATLAVTYAALSMRSVTLTVVDDQDAPLPGAVVIFRGAIDDAATVNDGTGSISVAGEVRRRAVADDAGVIGPLTLPDTLYDVAIAPPARAPALSVLDLRTGHATPSELAAAPPATLSGNASFEGAPLAGTRARVEPRGLLAGLGATASAVTDGSGAFVVSVADGASYDVILDASGDLGHAGATEVVEIAGASSIDVEARPSITVTGALLADGEAAAGAEVLVIDAATGRAVAHAVADGDGAFSVAVPDPSAP